MPAYNEEEAIEGVVTDWMHKLDALAIDYQLRLYDDGSRDRTLTIAQHLASTIDRLLVIGHSNRGHGPTILRGYHEAKSEWIFQTDSDGEIGSEPFAELWHHRQDFDLLLGVRQGRQAPWVRRLMTATARGTTRLLLGPRTGGRPQMPGEVIRDANVPYRLMRRERLVPLLGLIPPDTFAPNVAISGLAMAAGLRIHQHPVPSLLRAGGQPSLRHTKLLRAAARSWFETAAIAWHFYRRR